MTLQSGARLGPYEIDQLIGAGGMGKVYRAVDTRLKRTVAIKTIPPALATRTENRRRFETEARAIASLNHPHICALYDIGQDGDSAFMVMEYLEGETLAAVLKRGRLPYREALLHAARIAEALDEAHRRGVVHGDLKPGNLMIAAKGIKLLDFGLARLSEHHPTTDDNDPTVSLTRENTIVGTPQYMAPEQIEGKRVDSRSDVFAFGCVCYEMLTGKKTFNGETTALLLASILKADIPEPAAEFSPALQHVLRQCWAKNPDERWQSMGDLGREIRWIADNPETTPIESQRVSRREILAWGAAAVMGATAAAAWVRSGRRIDVEPSGVRFSIPEPPGLEVNFFQTAPAISPNGRMIAFFASNIVRGSIWLHHLDSDEFRELPETEGALHVFWSPDSRALAFFTPDKLKRVSPEGGAAQTICDSSVGTGGAWSSSDVIVFQKGQDGILHQVPAGGGTSTPLINPSSPTAAPQMYPCFFPDGKTVLFTQRTEDPEKTGIYAVRLGSSEVTRILPHVINARFAAPGHLIFGKGDKLLAVSFNPSSLQTEGEPRTVGSDVWSFDGASRFDVSATGVLVYAKSVPPSSHLEWFDRSGKPEKSVGPTGPFIHMDLSKDEKYAVLERYDDGYGSLWVLDLARNVPTRLTFGPSWALQAYWSPTTFDIVYARTNRTSLGIFRRSAGGGPEEELISLGPIGPSAPTDWSTDGRYIVIGGVTAEGRRDFWMLPLKGERKLQPYSPSPSDNFEGRVSPDGNWMAYMSTESGTLEIYVAPFPNPTAKWRISTAGGKQPRWRADGKELFYLAPDKTLMAVSMPSPDRAGLPTSLFRTRAIEYFFGLRSDYAPSKDGQRFLVQTGESQAQSISVITAWRSSLV